jgi:hypothetical protein
MIEGWAVSCAGTGAVAGTSLRWCQPARSSCWLVVPRVCPVAGRRVRDGDDLVPGTGSDVRQTVSVINTAAALAHRSAVLGVVPTGLFPRDLTFDQATGQVLLGNFNSSTIEEFPVPKAP